MRMRHLLAPFLLLLWMMAPAAASAEPADIEAATRGVVRVVIVGRDGEQIFPISHGTGFAVGRERIVTNAHVIAEAMEDDRLSIGIVPADGDEAVYARIVAVSQRNDLALLETTEALGLPPLTIAGNPARSGTVTAIGYPFNVDRAQGLSFADMFRAQPPVTAAGSLAGRRPSREMDTLLHTASIGAGNSGGPLVDDCGRVLGVNSFGAESDGSDAEFFFAVSTRELLPFLRANDVTPLINSTDCRSLSDIDAEQAAERQRAQDAQERRDRAAAAQLSERTEALRREIEYEILDQRSNRAFLAILLIVLAGAAATHAFKAHRGGDFRLRAIAGAIAVLALVLAMIAWFTRPSFTEVQTRLEDRLAEDMDEDGDSGPVAIASASGDYTCVLDAERSRVTGDPTEDVTLAWTDEGCVNGRTQYGQTDGMWQRVFVPANEATVSVNRFDPEARELTMERYLLDRETMTEARAARGQYSAPSCGADSGAVIDFGNAQGAITATLPDRPNERLVYRCEGGAGENE